jgi:protoporphyrin/coproporphyrin ferrochelatase
MYDAVLIVSFGGPEETKDVIPFLEIVTRGRSVPRERLLEVAEHYYHFGGKSPINDQCRELMAVLRNELAEHGLNLPLYWGNRNWHPFLVDTIRQMRNDGIRHALAFVTSAYSSYSSCRQYLENIAAAQAEVGEGAPKVDKLRVFYNHPAFIEAAADRVRDALSRFLPNEANLRNELKANMLKTSTAVPFALPWVRFCVTAHSIPSSMAATSDYEKQLRETARLVADAVGFSDFDLVFQSRSGPPSQPWLGPDILDHLRSLHAQGVENVLIAPLGFLSDHLEVLYDLDVEAANLAGELGMKMVRAATVGAHPGFVRMVRELIEERILRNEPNPNACPADCCPAPPRGDRSRALEVSSALRPS